MNDPILAPLWTNQTNIALYPPSNHSTSTATLRLATDSRTNTPAYGKGSPPGDPTNDLLPGQFLLQFSDRLSGNLHHRIRHIQITIPDTSLTHRVVPYPVAPHRHHLHLQLNNDVGIGGGIGCSLSFNQIPICRCYFIM
jgi:hypothetical protein